jgi:hypothetical protein
MTSFGGGLKPLRVFEESLYAAVENSFQRLFTKGPSEAHTHWSPIMLDGGD